MRLLLAMVSAFCVIGFKPGEALALDAGSESAPLTATARLQPSTVQPGGTAEVIISMKLIPNYYAYLERFKLVIETPDDIKLDEFKVSPLVQFKDSITKKMKDGIETSATMKALIEIPVGSSLGRRTAKFKLTYQACTVDYCLFPKHIPLNVDFTVSATNSRSSIESAPPPLINPDASQFRRALEKGTFFALIILFGMGFLTSLTPCIYPMIPITLAVLGARTANQSRWKSFTLSFVYVLGIAFTYSLLGVAAAKTGALFGAALSSIYVVTAIALIFVAMGLSMYGAFDLQMPAFVRNKIGGAKSGSGYGGAFVTGLIAGVVASPCVGPVLVGILAYIAQTQDLVLGFSFLFAFAMGMGVLFLILGTFSSLVNALPKAGGWMESVKFVFGSVMIAMALYYIEPLYPAWLFQLLAGVAMLLIASAYGAFESTHSLSLKGRLRKGVMLATFFIGVALAGSGVLMKAGVPLPGPGVTQESNESFPKLKWIPYSASALDSALKEQRPVLIDFYADWCEACKELERKTFVDLRVREISERFTLLKVDATEFDTPGIKELRQRYQVLGLPTLIFYDTTGRIRTDLTVTGFENADKFIQRMNEAAK